MSEPSCEAEGVPWRWRSRRHGCPGSGCVTTSSLCKDVGFLAMAAYLPVLTALVSASSVTSAVYSVLIALGTLAVVLTIALRHGEVVTRFVGARSDDVLLLRVLGLALLVAGAAEAAHVSAAVGAFLLGIALSGEVAEHIRGLLGPLRDIFAAVFFVFFGLSTDPASLPSELLPAAVLAIVGVATKRVTGWVAGRRTGVGPAGRLRAGTALVARGEFSIIIAGLVGASVIPAFAPTVAAYVLMMAVLGPLAPRLVDPLARRLARRAAERRADPPTRKRPPDPRPPGEPPAAIGWLR
ncbi:MAG TPA: cation:proton antiporter [Pseudonocardiaceae bacterium]|nr:cation:proton antiporter [Pseudonocardiaceae bacterium]